MAIFLYLCGLYQQRKMKFYRKEDIDTLRVWIDQARKPVVVSHTHPDGDALGSSSGLALLLKGLGKDVACVLSDTPADNLRFILPEEIPFFFRDQDAAAAEARIRKADLIFLADATACSRTAGLEEVLQAATARKMSHQAQTGIGCSNVVGSIP